MKEINFRGINFRGCKHLDFSDSYFAKKELLGSGSVFWLRGTPSENSMVQFCKKRGGLRLNRPDACIGECKAQCSDYEEIEHNVKIEGATQDE